MVKDPVAIEIPLSNPQPQAALLLALQTGGVRIAPPTVALLPSTPMTAVCSPASACRIRVPCSLHLL
jgi:hypothetical protein